MPMYSVPALPRQYCSPRKRHTDFLFTAANTKVTKIQLTSNFTVSHAYQLNTATDRFVLVTMGQLIMLSDSQDVSFKRYTQTICCFQAIWQLLHILLLLKLSIRLSSTLCWKWTSNFRALVTSNNDRKPHVIYF